MIRRLFLLLRDLGDVPVSRSQAWSILRKTSRTNQEAPAVVVAPSGGAPGRCEAVSAAAEALQWPDAAPNSNR